MSIYTFLVISHIVGTVLGVGGATFAEILHTKALKDRVVTPEESSTLKVTYRVLRVGLLLTVLSGFSFLLFYRLTGQSELIFDPKLWAKLFIVIVIMINALLLQAKAVPFWLGSAVSLTSWYGALVLGAWHDYPFSFMGTLIGYLVAIIVVAYLLHVVKGWYLGETT